MAVLDYVESVAGGPAWSEGAYAMDHAAVGAAYIARGPCYAAFLDGKLLGVAGIYLIHPGVGEAWAVPTEAGRCHGRAYHRAVRDGFRQIVAAYNLRRVQAKVLAGFWVGLRWAQGLGFAPEATLRRYGPAGEDFVLMAQFPGEALHG